MSFIVEAAKAGVEFKKDRGTAGGYAHTPVAEYPIKEVGVINPNYPVGDVRRYGIYPDGSDVLNITFNATTTLAASAGAFNNNMIGMVVCSPLSTGSYGGTPPKIISILPDGSGATLNIAATGSGTGNARIGTYWERDYATRLANVLTNSTVPGITIDWVAGLYCTSFNLNSSHSKAKMHFQQGAEFSGLIHIIPSAGFPSTASALSDLILSGHITTYDRFGAIGVQDSDLSLLNVICKSDATKHLTGIYGRGVHMYSSITNTKFGNFIVEDCPCIGTVYNTDGAFVVDSSDCHDNTYGDIWVKDSAGHGVYLIGANQTVNSIRVDGWGYGTHDRTLQEAQTLSQSKELTGVWLKRCSGLKVDNITVNQIAGTRSNALYDFRIEDTQNAIYTPPSWTVPKIHSLECLSITHRGISIGDINNPGNIALAQIDYIDVANASGCTVDTGYSYITIAAGSPPSGSFRSCLYNTRIKALSKSTQGNPIINTVITVKAYTTLVSELIDTSYGHPGTVLVMLGECFIGAMRHNQTGNSTSPTTIIIGPNNDGVVNIGCIRADAQYLPSITLLDLPSASKFDIGKVYSTGYRGVGVVRMNTSSNGIVRIGRLSDTTAAGTGIRWQGCTDVAVEGGTVTGFLKGIYATTSTNVRCRATSLSVTGNTTNTDLASGQVSVDATSQNVTL
jgi:hypothetical protein